MLFTPLTPTDVTPGSGSYQDIDSALVPAGASGVRVRLENTTGSRQTVGLRKNGSTDTLETDIAAGAAVHADVGVDASGIFECFIDLGVTVTLLGYWGDEAVFFDNAVAKGALASANVYHDIDISADTGADTAIAAIGLCLYPATTSNWGVRKNGSTTTLVNTGDRWNPFIIGVDGSEIFEARVGNASAAEFHLIGYVKSGGVFHTELIAAPIVADATWTDYTLSEATATYGFFVAESGTFSQSAGVRQNGSADDWYRPVNSRKSYLSAQPDSSGVVEVQRSGSALDIREVGYVEAASGGGTTFPQALSATASGTATVDTVSALALGLSATVAGGASLVRQIAKSLSAAAGGAAAVARRVGKPLSAGATGAAAVSMDLSYLRALDASATGAASLTASKAFLVMMSAVAAASATLVKHVSKTLSAAVAGEASTRKQAAKTLEAEAAGAASLTPAEISITQALSANATGTPSLGSAVVFGVGFILAVFSNIFVRVLKSIFGESRRED